MQRKLNLKAAAFACGTGRSRRRSVKSRAGAAHTACVRIVPHLLRWFHRHARNLPWRRTSDPYAIWVSEVMLQQTQVSTVVPYFERWMKELPDVQALADAQPEKLLKLWEGLGYYSRVRNLQRAACRLVTDHAGRFPADFEQILALPGVGRYTAGAICSIAFNQPKPILDGNVVRVLARLFVMDGDPRLPKINREFWDRASSLVEHAANLESQNRLPEGATRACSALNQSLMELGAVLCTPANPRCQECPVASFCQAQKQNRVPQFPQRRQRTEAVPRLQIGLLVKSAAKLLVRQRPANVVNAGYWELPTFETSSGRPSPGAAAGAIGARLLGDKPLCTIKHSITRYRITLDVYEAVLKNGNVPNDLSWTNTSSLSALPMTAASRRVLQRINAKKSSPKATKS